MVDAPTVSSASGQPVLLTPRLSLVPIAPSDAAALHPTFADPDIMRYVDYPASRELADTVRRIEQWIIPLPEWHATWTLRLNATGAAIGIANFHHREIWNRRAEIGYVLGRAHWRQGLMREALGALIDYCFQALDMNRLEATIDPDNHPATRLATQLGFRCEGARLRERLLVAGRYRDVALYGLLRRDWRAGPARALAPAGSDSEV
jgi:RimJ/RimL family protein N-acetyltransferase